MAVKNRKKPANKKIVPLGKPLQLTDADLDRLAEVTPADIEQSKAAWRRNVPDKYKNLLDATVKPKGQSSN